MSAPNTFNIGRDGAQLTIIDTLLGQVTFNGQIGFDAKPRYKKLESETIQGNTLFRGVPNGHEGSFDFDRQDASVSAYFAQKEANFFAQLAPSQAFITQTVTELDGSITTWQYQGVELYLDDDGNWKGLDKVPQKVSFQASRKIRIS